MRIRILLMGLLLAAVANAQTVYHDASTFPLLGKATESTLTRYERLPDSLQNISRKRKWICCSESCPYSRSHSPLFFCRSKASAAELPTHSLHSSASASYTARGDPKRASSRSARTPPIV